MSLGFEGGVPLLSLLFGIFPPSESLIVLTDRVPAVVMMSVRGDLFVVGTGSQSIRCVQFHFWAGQNDAGVGFSGVTVKRALPSLSVSVMIVSADWVSVQ